MKTKLFAVIALALLNPLLVLAQQTQQPTAPQQPPWEWYGHGHMWHGGWGLGWMFVLFVLFIVFLVLIGRAFLFHCHRSDYYRGHHHWGPQHMLARPSGDGHSWGDPTYSALKILNERFAKGEIQKEEYEDKKTAILSSGRQ